MLDKIKEVLMTYKAIDVKIYEAKKQLNECEPNSEMFEECMSELNDLYDIKAKLKALKKRETPFKLDLNTLISSGIGFASIILILTYENEDIITTKGINIATKMLGK